MKRHLGILKSWRDFEAFREHGFIDYRKVGSQDQARLKRKFDFQGYLPRKADVEFGTLKEMDLHAYTSVFGNGYNLNS